MDACRPIYWWSRTCYITFIIFEIFYESISYKNPKFNINEPFDGLFTQGMVCHETYKDENNWVSPDEIETINGKKYLKNNKSILITVGPSESMSKSKNTIDPENIISHYGRCARLFILSDSPPEKDVQWSEEGINSSYKFIQKLWNLNNKITDEIKKHTNDNDDKLIKNINKYIKK